MKTRIIEMEGIKNNPSEYPFVGLYIMQFDKEIDVYQAVKRPDKVGGGLSVGTYSTDLSIDEVIERAKVDMHICRNCGKKVGIENLWRVGFAGACCEDCLPELKAKYEYDGWTN